MIWSRGFVYITAADFIVRSAYQMGKTPLLPIYAAALGAGDAFLGLIVSVSTLTGMVFKPFVGVLSDRWGRRLWLIVGTGFFVVMPFVYRFVHTPEQLFAVRIVHGLATAIYGPVTLAYVSEQSQSRRAERLGWFSVARNAGYVVGPVVAGGMLLVMDPVSVFTVIGILSSLAFAPVLLLPETMLRSPGSRLSLTKQALLALAAGGRTPAIWLAGGLESVVYIGLYATKAFLPLYALSVGFNVAMVGAFFAIQEIIHMLLNPLGGRVGDHFGYLRTVPLGMMVLGLTLPLVVVADNVVLLVGVAVLMGVAQSLVQPSTLALVSTQVDERNLAVSMGLVGAMRNAGKVIGPVLAGLLIHWLDYAFTFQLLGLGLLIGALVVWQHTRFIKKRGQQRLTISA